jgi:dolichol kinase
MQTIYRSHDKVSSSESCLQSIVLLVLLQTYCVLYIIMCLCGIRYLKYVQNTRKIYQFSCLILNNDERHILNNIIYIIIRFDYNLVIFQSQE